MGSVAFYASAPPVIHVLNKRYELAFVSPLMRLALPVLGALIVGQLQSCGEQEFLCPLGGAIAGLAIGTAVAMIVDWSLAWAPVSAAPSSPSYCATLDPAIGGGENGRRSRDCAAITTTVVADSSTTIRLGSNARAIADNPSIACRH